MELPVVCRRAYIDDNMAASERPVFMTVVIVILVIIITMCSVSLDMVSARRTSSVSNIGFRLYICYFIVV